jgi:hypothetical protein
MVGTIRTLLGPVAKRRAPSEPVKAAPATTPAVAEREAVRQRWGKPPEADIAERLGVLDLDQLHQVAGAFSLSSFQDDDEEDLRSRIVAYVDEWASDKAGETDGDAEAAYEAGRREAAGFVEEEMFSAIADTTPPAEWRETMGVSEQRMAGAGRPRRALWHAAGSCRAGRRGRGWRLTPMATLPDIPRGLDPNEQEALRIAAEGERDRAMLSVAWAQSKNERIAADARDLANP